MGILNVLTGGLGDSKPVEIPKSVTPAVAEKTPEEIAAAEDAKKKAALVAANAGATAPQQTTVGGGNADVTRKILLGL